ncbi:MULTISPECIES: zinc-binding dehydrogenase [Pseudonocardia]|uniref:Quinone oxidoreductase 1 n=2 Tax=Pseudonocardia TaxID=1847 RepID=A0A1Y2N4Z1_PSEAH|nr:MULTISPECIES: zinc-binding dehydrogenase [Pseudonocardia]OSY42540.1 Quinone oxidoreductase 1 [Pseudonocardia autotrophica]TDN76059.1 NADPH:quinone reductase-like Zn-dependent oxidoreductase [Pseudonocardia autotrophica]BBG00036.1 oxidoreductase [Pseudonocardia autotrophica]GEC28078.1 oxidoreductase [Pseudonocardia saturnea]
MLAIVQHHHGGPEVLVPREIPDPEPGAGEVRIRVEAAGVHLVDATLRAGGAGPFPAPALPTVPGREVAGIVDALGPGSRPDLLGARVCAHLGPGGSGGYAAAAIAAADGLHRLPDGVGAAAAVAVLGTGRMTEGLLELARPRAGETALVTSAAGGIGTLLVQALAAEGLTVLAAAGSGRLPGPLPAGVTPLAYDRPGWTDDAREATGGRGVDLVFDGVGGDAGRGAFDLLAPGGRVLLHGWSAGTPTPFGPDELWERALTVSVALGPPILALGLRRLEERALARLADGRWSPVVSSYPLADAARAHADLEARRTRGKVVLVP